mgnify:FL=1
MWRLKRNPKKIIPNTILGFLQADVNGNGTLDYGEFVAITVHLQRMDNDEYLRRAFSFFDVNGDGFIDSNELKDALKDELGLDGLDMINDIIQEVDTDKVINHLFFITFSSI